MAQSDKIQVESATYNNTLLLDFYSNNLVNSGRNSLIKTSNLSTSLNDANPHYVGGLV